MHGYFILLNSAKMSKSSGEFLRVQLLLDKGYDDRLSLSLPDRALPFPADLSAGMPWTPRRRRWSAA